MNSTSDEVLEAQIDRCFSNVDKILCESQAGKQLVSCLEFETGRGKQSDLMMDSSPSLVPVRKYFFAAAVGQCPRGTDFVATGNVFMGARQCSTLGGSYQVRKICLAPA